MSRLAAYYDRDAHDLAARYETVSFGTVHAPILKFLPPVGAHVADIGAGAGRDARALAALGYEVLAVEPSIEMRRQANPSKVPGLEWCDDRLPDLRRVRSLGRRFDFVLCAAVLMHLEAEALPASFEALASLLSETGRLAVSLRDARQGDPEGLYFDHSVRTLLRAASLAKLHVLAQGSSTDSLDRTDVLWRWFVFTGDNSSSLRTAP